ncbi:MAG TPA: hypothetical protein VN285_05895 [Candidatus Deferrimicrobium sp.]|nr:hypothetical protein [Candidatus Deferrimicrobium sp.]
MKASCNQILRLLLPPIVALTTLGAGCPTASQVGEKPPDRSTTFAPEYDYMEGYDVFPYGHGTASTAFAPCSTKLQVWYDEEIRPAELLDWNSVGGYMYEHAQKTGSGAEVKLKHGAYLIAVQDVYNRPPDSSVTLGYTDSGGEEGWAWTVVFVQTIRDIFPGDTLAINHAVIHEMGHMRANLTELCDPATGEMSDYHNDGSCVMGDVKVPPCTGTDASANPHFCSACCWQLMHVQW